MSNSYIQPPVGESPRVPTSFLADDGNIAVPNNNELRVFGDTTEDWNENGIETRADDDDDDNLLQVVLTNRFYSEVECEFGLTENLIEFDLGAFTRAYRFTFDVAYVADDAEDCYGATIFATFKTNGTTATRVGTPYVISQEDFFLTALDMVAGTGPDQNKVFLTINQTAELSVFVYTQGHYLRTN